MMILTAGNFILTMGVDTRGALGAEAPPPPDFQALYYTLYMGMAKIVELVVINLNIGSCVVVAPKY